uniref:Target of EGR1 protein 1 n=1 Tax=Callorhinchus milii TaxID=7868 RepID=A0A4W3IQE7_CALMI|eukprot:gi/632963806/ref/XP_007898088.1/ PREDICTED: target of EGR1 protein 1 [Callorhinchus milii]
MSFMKVPVVDVHIDNFKEIWPSLLLAVRTANFIAIDTELSGLGTRKALLAQSVEDRYNAICQAARTRSILSLGIACFKKLPDKEDEAYLCQVYNLILLCMDEYIIEPQSVQFLVQHGFDFNKQYAKGIPYHKGNDKSNESQGQNIRALFLEIIQSKKPLILHNGLIDLAFLYQCFYAHLPNQLLTFTADLSEMFPAGIYDTKYASEFETRFVASYLEYAYKKCRRENTRLLDMKSRHLSIEFLNYQQTIANYIDYRYCSLPDSEKDITDKTKLGICEKFSAYGWCPNGIKCPLSHNTDLIIDEDERIKDDKRKRRKARKRRKQNAMEVTSNPPESTPRDHAAPDISPPCKVVCQNSDEQPETTEMPDAGEAMHNESLNSSKGCSDQKEMEETPDVREVKAESFGDLHHGDGMEGISWSDSDRMPNSSNDMENKTEKKCRKLEIEEKTKAEKAEGGTHRAGFDAFMTGFIMAYTLMWKKGDSEHDSDCDGTKIDMWLPDLLNKLYLSGKSIPLQICKSSFSKSSKAHQAKIELAWGKK